MIITVLTLAIILSVPLTGGSLGRMSQLRFTSTWLLVASLGVQILITIVLVDLPHPGVLAGLHILSYLLAAAFLWRNRSVPGLLVIAAGGMMNFAAISANSGIMPASPRALEIAGMALDEGFQNSTAVEGARLAFLGDVFAIPASWPFANVFSVGDVVLLVGVGMLVHTIGRWPAQPAAEAARRLLVPAPIVLAPVIVESESRRDEPMGRSGPDRADEDRDLQDAEAQLRELSAVVPAAGFPALLPGDSAAPTVDNITLDLIVRSPDAREEIAAVLQVVFADVDGFSPAEIDRALTRAVTVHRRHARMLHPITPPPAPRPPGHRRWTGHERRTDALRHNAPTRPTGRP